MSGKTVYVLGAGFSKRAGLPLQNEILARIKETTYFGDSPGTEETIKKWIDDFVRVKKFLDDLFPETAAPNLEDVFTLLDYSIENESNVRTYDWLSLVKVRDSLNGLILGVFYPESLDFKDDYNYIASLLVKRRVLAGQKNDEVSVVSLNWDTLLEDSIFQCVHDSGTLKRIDVDYCCRTAPFVDSGSPHICSLIQKAKQRFNIKIVKLHGSMNWLICPACNILYTGVGSLRKQSELYVKSKYCAKCEESGKKIQLNHFFVSPTFLKTFVGPHSKMTWYNAFIELSEADELVFIGYSFPISDYHFRALLRSAIKASAKITVVLPNWENPSLWQKKSRGFLASMRYQDFFPSHRIKFEFGGVEGYFGLKRNTSKMYRRNVGQIKSMLNV